MYSNREPESCSLNGHPIEHMYHADSCRLSIELPLSEDFSRELRIEFLS